MDMEISQREFERRAADKFRASLMPDDLAKLFSLPPEARIGFLLERSGLSETEASKTVAECSGLPFFADFECAPEPEKILPLRLMNEYQCLPCSDGAFAVSWPPTPDMKKWVGALAGGVPRWKIVPASAITKKNAEVFGVGAESLSGKDMADFADLSDAEVEEDENAAIIKFVNEIISRALSDRATDIHIEPQRDALNIRCRIDGNLVPLRLPENMAKFKDAVISRIKIMARLNISEKRRPQDGRIAFMAKDGEEIDIRVSSLPTLYGESVSLRLLSQRAQPVGIEDLGFLPEDIKKISKPLSRPHGIILVTGPTGSGKSTTLTAFIRRLRSPEVRIITVEDPVEYEVGGVNQTQVHPEIGLTFSSVLRSVLRQDPDIIMVGEIRDRETADIAIRASLTGHLVLSTLHTNDAAGALTRLIDMEIEPFLIASSVEMILAQRLVRRLCSCAVAADYDKSYIDTCLVALDIDPSEAANYRLPLKPAGCEKCRGLGYYGRVAIVEILLMNDQIHSMIAGCKTALEIRRVAQMHGMRTLQESGWELVKRGITGMDEIMYYANIVEDAKDK